MTLTRLTFVDIYRDGGSYEARFDTDDAAGFGLWLQRSAMPDARGLHHRWLFAYRGHTRPAAALPVVTGSEEERSILDALDKFLSSNDPKAPGDAQAALDRLRKMIGYIRAREPCLPSDLRSAGFIE